MALTPFSNDLFTAASLTDAFNKLPDSGFKVSQMGLFRGKGVATDTVVIENKNGVLQLLETRTRGDDAQTYPRSTRERRSFVIPHIPLIDSIDPSDVRNILAMGSDSQLENLATFVTERMSELRMAHDQTLEWMRLGALKGQILDGDGTTVLYDLYNEFNVTQSVVNFQLSSATFDVKAACRQVLDAVRAGMRGDTYNRVHMFVSTDFFNALVDHPSVKEVWDRWNSSSNQMWKDNPDVFVFGGITFEIYDTVVTDSTGTARPFFGAAEGRAFPVGTRSTFVEYYAPANFNETVNRIGQRFYAKIKEEDFGRGYRIYTEQNPLPICMRPEAMIQVNMT